MKTRKAKILRKTKETNIRAELNIDGSGESKINYPIPFLGHMFTLFSKHGLFDLKLTAQGDIEVDLHHLIEDTGLALGEALDKEKIKLYLDAEMLREFFESFVYKAGISLHIELVRGKNTHHKIEAIFKAFGVALSRACAINPRKKGVPSTKGRL